MQLVIKLLTEDNIPMSCAAQAAVMPNCDSTNFGAKTMKPLTSKPNNTKHVSLTACNLQKGLQSYQFFKGFNKNYRAANPYDQTTVKVLINKKC